MSLIKGKIKSLTKFGTLSVLAFGATIVLTGCGATQVRLSSKFDAEKTAPLLEKGNNTIGGSALIRQNNGNTVTCAGETVYLVPETDYSTERMSHLYGNTTKGFISASLFMKRKVFKGTPAAYQEMTKQTVCNAQGFFKFKNVADGEFYITTSIVWKIDDFNFQGGTLMRSVSVENGESTEIVLAP